MMPDIGGNVLFLKVEGLMFINLDKAIEQKQVIVEGMGLPSRGSRHVTLTLGNNFGIQQSKDPNGACNESPIIRLEETIDPIIVYPGQVLLVETAEKVYSKFMMTAEIHIQFGVLGVGIVWPKVFEVGVGVLLGALSPQQLVFSLFVPQKTIFMAGFPFVDLYFQTERKAQRNYANYPRSIKSLRDLLIRGSNSGGEIHSGEKEEESKISESGKSDGK